MAFEGGELCWDGQRPLLRVSDQNLSTIPNPTASFWLDRQKLNQAGP